MRAKAHWWATMITKSSTSSPPPSPSSPPSSSPPSSSPLSSSPSSSELEKNLQVILSFEGLRAEVARIFPLVAVCQLVLRQCTGIVEDLHASGALDHRAQATGSRKIGPRLAGRFGRTAFSSGSHDRGGDGRVALIFDRVAIGNGIVAVGHGNDVAKDSFFRMAGCDGSGRSGVSVVVVVVHSVFLCSLVVLL